MVVASRVMERVNAHSPDAVFVDGTGIGWGVVDRLSQLGCSTVRGIDFGARADRTDGVDAMVRYANKRAEMWGYMKEWCKAGCLPDDRGLRADLTAVDYGYAASDAILLEKKDDMRRRGLASPDDGDALALTFAYLVFKTDWAEERTAWRWRGVQPMVHCTDCRPVQKYNLDVNRVGLRPCRYVFSQVSAPSLVLLCSAVATTPKKRSGQSLRAQHPGL